MGQKQTHALQQKADACAAAKQHPYSISLSALASGVGGTVKTKRVFRATDQSIRGNQEVLPGRS